MQICALWALVISGCAPATDPCASAPDSAQASLAIGQGTVTSTFEPLEDHVPRELVMGEQGVAMFHRLALRAESMVPVETGRTREGWRLSVRTPDGEPLGTVWSPHLLREIPDGFEVVDVRVIPTVPPLQLWDTDVVLEATAEGRCGGRAEAQLTMRAVRVGGAR